MPSSFENCSLRLISLFVSRIIKKFLFCFFASPVIVLLFHTYPVAIIMVRRKDHPNRQVNYYCKTDFSYEGILPPSRSHQRWPARTNPLSSSMQSILLDVRLWKVTQHTLRWPSMLLSCSMIASEEGLRWRAQSTSFLGKCRRLWFGAHQGLMVGSPSPTSTTHEGICSSQWFEP